MRSRVLVYFCHNPCPPRSGAHRRCLQMLEGLVRIGCEVSLASCPFHSETEWTDDAQRKLRGMGVKEVFVYRPRLAGRICNKLEGFLEARRGYEPELRSGFRCPVSLRRWFSRVVETTRAEVLLMNYAWFDRLVDHHAWRNLLRVIDTHDICTVSTRLWQEVSRLINEFKAGRLEDRLFDEELVSDSRWKPDAGEMAIYDRYTAAIAVSQREAQLLEGHLSKASVHWIPITLPDVVGTNDYSGNALCSVGPNPFNLQGLIYFAHRVLPTVRQRVPDFMLDVTGFFGEALLTNDRIRHRGFVPALESVFRHAAMSICPVYVGTGQQVKVVEAMANGLPVVALQAAAQSSPLQHEENGLIAANAAEFADHIVRLWQDVPLRRKLGTAARETAREWACRHDCAHTLAGILSKESC